MLLIFTVSGKSIHTPVFYLVFHANNTRLYLYKCILQIKTKKLWPANTLISLKSGFHLEGGNKVDDYHTKIINDYISLYSKPFASIFIGSSKIDTQI